MTTDEIDAMLDKMAEEAAATGDENLLPGAISMACDSYFRLPLGVARCTNIIHGIRYRGVQVLVARARDDKVMNRSEDEGLGAPYFELEPKA
ncbi:hypothetical protein [Caulobacter sp. BP25]|uniref:hypothetical protein n=1 Tax=Caulobacter sp. BP25 TaxID=2048900 RepID=UPI000C12A1B8|nr:hypothetical protein [Caulobacter sp. BP25]PHY20945.1 hypothetical protein CSW59_06975 [Caulobacter sp. BP25]